MKTQLMRSIFRAGRLVALWLPLIALLVLVSCAGPPEEGPALEAGESSWSIRVFVEASDGRKQLDFVPVLDVSRPRVNAKTADGVATTKAALSTKAVDGGVSPPTPTPEGLDSNANYSSWALVWGAAVECGMNGNFAAQSWAGRLSPTVPPWNTPDDWFIFPEAPQSCDQALNYEETMLCVSDKLAEVADAVGNTHWDKVASVTTPPSGIPAGAWLIPPQAAKDKFIVRDLAIHTLAHIARLDARIMTNGSVGGVCSQLYAEARDPGVVLTRHTLLFNSALGSTPLYPPSQITIAADATVIPLIDDRLAFEAHVLRGAARLLRELIHDSVYADLAGAEQRSARSLDARRGNRIAWAQSDAQNGPFNSIAHALRVLTGRWEMGPHSLDPRCAGVPALSLLEEDLQNPWGPHSPYGPDASARFNDRTVDTPGRVAAVRLFETTGVVIPTATLDAMSSSTLVDGMGDVVVGLRARADGVSEADLAESATALRNAVKSIAEADLRFAAERVFNTWRLLTNQSDPPAPSALNGGLTVESLVVAFPPDVMIIKGGLTRGRLPTDVMARAGGLLEAAQCYELYGINEAINADSMPMYLALSEPLAEQYQRASFQDVFSVAQAIERRLVVIEHEASVNSPVVGATPFPVAEDVARSAVGEIRPWAGPGRVIATSESDPGGMGRHERLTLRFVGFTKKEVAAPETPNWADDFKLVYGAPWVAECAAKLRADCPTDLSFATAMPVGSSTLADEGTRRQYGTATDVRYIEFDLRDKPGNFAEFRNSTDMFPTEHLYVVGAHDPKDPTRGWVLGTISRARPSNSWTAVHEVSTSFVVSAMQRELINAVIGFDAATSGPDAIGKPEIGTSSSAKGSSGCLPGVPRDLFVPLENELTSDSDGFETSWRHYLTLAKQSATKADELGRELLKIAVDKELRREASGEALAGICGGAPSMSDLSTNSEGEIVADPKDKSLAVCLEEETRDIVFLGRLPKDLPTKEPERTAWLKNNVLRCLDAGESNALCKNDLYPVLSVDDLGMVESYTPPDAAKGCADAGFLVSSLRTGFNDTKYVSAMSQSWAAPEALAGLVGTIRMTTDENDDWKVTVGGAVVMDSKDKFTWPGCLDPGEGLEVPPRNCNFDTKPVNSGLNRMFRNCGVNGLFDTERQNYKLGQCPTTLGGDTMAAGSPRQHAQAELNAIRWRVEGALFLLAGMVGRAPEGMFTTPVLVANYNFPSPAWDAPNAPPSLWAAARFLPDHFAGSLVPAGSAFTPILTEDATTLDANAIGTRYALADAFGSLSTTSVADELPWWARDLFAQRNRYLLVKASNPSLSGAAAPAAAKATMGAREVGTLLTGMRCPRPYGDPEVSEGLSQLILRLAGPKMNLVSDGLLKMGSTRRVFPLGSGYEAGYWAKDSPTYVAVLDGRACDMQAVGEANVRNASKVPPAERVTAFINSGAACSRCEAAHQLAQAIGFACYSASLGVLPSSGIEPPSLNSADDLPLLESWIAATGAATRARVGGLFMERVPLRVITDHKSGRIGSGSTSGSQGERILEMSDQLNTLVSAWTGAGLQIENFRGALNGARTAIMSGDSAHKRELLNLNIQRYRVYRDMIAAAGNVVGAGATAKPYLSIAGAAITAAGTVGFGIKELDALKDLKETTDKDKDLVVLKALNDLQLTLGAAWGELERNIGTVRSTVARIKISAQALEALKSKARYEAAKGLGKDYFVDPDGKASFLPVNIVMRRQYDALEKRYKNAVDHARYQALLARLAIEQRLGQRLESMKTGIGPLPAPTGWREDFCRAGGLDYFNYESLSSTAGVGPGADPKEDEKIINGFADSFIGDYVDKLERLVEYYNVEYPSHEGDDTAILSLREDLLTPKPICVADAQNLLYYSGDLTRLADSPPLAGEMEHRWQRVNCAAGSTKCLAIDPAVAMFTPNGAPDEANRGGVTWLHDYDPTAPVDAGADADSDADGGDGGDTGVSDSADAAPFVVSGGAGTVFQEVKLQPEKQYLLSWWDQARTADGQLRTDGDPGPYRTQVQDSKGTTLFSIETIPFKNAPPVGDAGADTDGGDGGTPGAPWSVRHTLSFKVDSAGIYRVAFASSVVGDLPGSVAIANVQLEAVPAGGTESAYVATDATRAVVVSQCATRSAEDLRSAFRYRCSGPGFCYYELAAPIIIDTGLLNTPTASLIGKLARGNFNFRHIDLALNIVGTGVRDCTKTPTSSCFGSGYTEYTLEHDSTHAGVMAWDGTVQFFDFGLAPVEHGKALSAERYITMPIGSADTSLLSQPGISKPEYRGRPLDGAYRLKIWDSPALQWHRLEDIQFILKYRYWSKLTRKGTG